MVDSWPTDFQSSSVQAFEATQSFGTAASQAARPVSTALKRILDILCALFALVALPWVFLAIAAAIGLTSRGPILFRQRRTGLNGRIFCIYKFRTMSVVEDGDIIAHAARNDLRITRLGSFLRRTSLDELPQVLNVLKGEMSFVGPRPHALAHDRHYGALIPSYNDRFCVRPGLTGLAQVRGLRGEIHHLDGMTQRIAADTEYAAQWSLRGDLLILLRTMPLLINHPNAY